MNYILYKTRIIQRRQKKKHDTQNIAMSANPHFAGTILPAPEPCFKGPCLKIILVSSGVNNLGIIEYVPKTGLFSKLGLWNMGLAQVGFTSTHFPKHPCSTIQHYPDFKTLNCSSSKSQLSFVAVPFLEISREHLPGFFKCLFRLLNWY